MRKQEKKTNKETNVKHIKKVTPAKEIGKVKSGGTSIACTPSGT